MVRFSVFSLFSLGFFLPTPALACDSVDSCMQGLACKSGFTLGAAPLPVAPPNSFLCTDTVPAQTVLPECAPLNGHEDWQYNSGTCSRTNANGTTVKATENIKCPSGTVSALPAHMKVPPPGCQSPARTDYVAPVFLPPGSTAKSRFDIVSASDAIKTIFCTTGAVKKTGANYYCELYLTSARSTTPKCSDLGGKKWTFDTDDKKCTRTANGQSFENTTNIVCESIATYNATTGKCVTPKGTYYDEPRLQ